MSEEILKQIAKDVAVMKQKLEGMEEELSDIAKDMHVVKPEYMEKLKRMEKEGTISKKEFEEKFGVKI